MKTAKRNARTATIFNNVMHAVTSMYCVQKKDMELQQVYDALKEKDGLVFHFLDTDGKVIYNTFGPNKDLINKGRRVSLVDSDNYIRITIPESKKFYVDIHEFKDNKLDMDSSISNSVEKIDSLYKSYFIRDLYKDYIQKAHQEKSHRELILADSFISNLIDRIDSLSESYFIRDLCKDFIQKAYRKKNYRALILFETIFGYQFLTRKQIDRIRYIYFSNDVIYDVLGGYYCFSKFLTERIIWNLAGNIEVYSDINEILKWLEESGIFHIIKECLTDSEYYYDADEVYAASIAYLFATKRTKYKESILTKLTSYSFK
jgi:hypothetical protein